MISPRIDLTENRDFSGRFLEFSQMDTEIPDFIFYEKMTPEEMDKFIFLEKFFGQSTHHTERYKIFNQEKKFEEEVRTHCARCGKEIRAPWKKIYDLCPECDKEMEIRGVPWKNEKVTPDAAWGPHHDVAYDLFNAR